MVFPSGGNLRPPADSADQGVPPLQPQSPGEDTGQGGPSAAAPLANSAGLEVMLQEAEVLCGTQAGTEAPLWSGAWTGVWAIASL